MDRKFSLLEGDLKDLIEERVAQVGLDFEIPVMDNDTGNFEERKDPLNKVPLHYNIDKYFKDRIKKPLTFEEIAAMDDFEQEPCEIGRVHFRYYFKQKMALIEEEAAKSLKSISE